MTITLTITVADHIRVGEAIARLHHAAVLKVMKAHTGDDRQQIIEAQADAIVSGALLDSFNAAAQGDNT